MKQISFSQAEFNQKKKKTRREQFLQEMERIVPWQRLLDKLAPEYFQDSEGRRGLPLHEEQEQVTRPGDAPNQEGLSMVLRHEGAYWRGC